MSEAELLEEVDKERGFLPARNPLTEFDTDHHRPAVARYLRHLDQLGTELPDLVESDNVRQPLRSIETPPAGLVSELNDREIHRLCQLSGFFASAYVNHDLPDGQSISTLPAGIAVPLYETSMEIGRQPILSYDLLCLHNFQLKDPDGEITLDNLDVVQRFTHYDDERWFVIVHVAIEAAAAPAISACPVAQQAIRDDDPQQLQDALETIAESLSEQTKIMQRMTEGNDTEVFANEFRPYYDGFDDIVYEGVDELEGQPQSFRGGSGAQSSLLPSLDATLGVEHEATEMTEKLGDMRSYMPPLHRTTIEQLDNGPSISEYVTEQGSDSLRSTYNNCIAELEQFRRTHFKQVIQYIREVTGETEGTGGTNYMPYLRKLEQETKLSHVGEKP